MTDIAELGYRVDTSGLVRGTKALDSMDAAGKNVVRGSKNLTSSFSGIRSAIAGLGIVGLTSQLSGAGKEFQRFNRLLSKSDLEFVRKEADRLGLSLQVSASGFAKFSAAAKGTSLEGQGARDVFTGLNVAVSGLGLSADQSRGALTAFEQILSKGKVQAEELRGQLGERIPGAFQIAARAVGMTTAELDKQLQLGNVMAEDFLPKFAAELERTYSGSAASGARELTAEQNRLSNSFLEIKNITANSGFLDSYTDSVKSLTSALSSDAAISGAKALGQALGFVIENLLTIGGVTAGFAGARALGPLLASWRASVIAFNASLVTTKTVSQGAAGAFNLMGVGISRNITQTVALTGAQKALAVASRGASAALALVGGPAGLAIIAAAGLFTLGTRASEADRTIEQLDSSLLTLSSTGLSAASVKSAELANNIRLLNIETNQSNMAQLQADLTTNNVLIDETNQRISRLRRLIEIETQGDIFGSSEIAVMQYNSELKKLEEILPKAEQKQKLLTVQLGVARETLTNSSSALNTNTESLNVNSSAAETYSKSVTSLIQKEKDRQNTIIELNKAIESGIDSNGVLLDKYNDLTGETERLADAERKRNEELEEAKRKTQELDRLTGNDLLRSQEELNTVIKQSELYTKNYAKALDQAKAALAEQGLIQGTEEYNRALEALGFRTEETTSKVSSLWQNTTDKLQDSLAGFFEQGLSGWDNFADSVKGIFKKLIAQLLAQWAASGIAGLFNGQGFSGFSISNAFGGGGFNFGGLFGSSQAQQAVGNAFGQGAGNAFSGVVNGAGGVFGAVGGVNQISSGIDQGGSSGAFSVASGALSLYKSYQKLLPFFKSFTGPGSTVVTTGSNVLAAPGFATGTGTAATTVTTTAGATTGTGTAAAGSGFSSLGATVQSVGMAIGVGLLADKYLNDSRVQKGFAVEFDIRKESIKDLFDGNFSDFFKKQFTAPLESLKETFGGRSGIEIAQDQFRGVAEADNFSPIALQDGTDFLGGVDGKTVFFGAELDEETLTKAGKLLEEKFGFDAADGIFDGVLRVFDESRDFATDNEAIVSEVLSSIAEIKVGFTELERGAAKSLGDAFINMDTIFDRSADSGIESHQRLLMAIQEVYGKSEEEANKWLENSVITGDRIVEIFDNASGNALTSIINDFGQASVVVSDSFSLMSESANDSIMEMSRGLSVVGDSAEEQARRIAASLSSSIPSQIGITGPQSQQTGTDNNDLIRDVLVELKKNNKNQELQAPILQQAAANLARTG